MATTRRSRPSRSTPCARRCVPCSLASSFSVGAIPPTTPPSSPVHHPCPACSSFPCCTDPHANTPTQINTASFFLSSFLSFFLSFLLPSFIDSSIHPFHTQVLKPTPLPPAPRRRRPGLARGAAAGGGGGGAPRFVREQGGAEPRHPGDEWTGEG